MSAQSGRGSRPRRRRSPKRRVSEHSSLPTGRTAYAETRAWLLAHHGPVCAYCAKVCSPRTITLDHVTPRKGQSAYDRRDNLVLACRRCNTAKADKPFLVFLFAQRSRAERLLRYGTHLSEGILDILRGMVGESGTATAIPAMAVSSASRMRSRIIYGPDDGPSPYREEASPYRQSA